jgi:hypothetical protein
MNSEELKIMFDHLFNHQILRENIFEARQMKKDANKIKKDKYRLRKAVKKSQLQNRIKELYEEERITQLKEE